MDPWFLTLLGDAYRKVAGPSATLSSIPLALLRRLYGDDYVVRLNQKPFTLSLHDTVVSFHILLYRRWEPFETSIFQTLTSPGFHIVDVGAHIGYYAILFGDLTGPGGRVLAIEPEPNNARLLRKNVKDRGLLEVVQVAETAVGESTGTATLYKTRLANQGDNRLYKPSRSGTVATAVEVPMRRIDDLVAGWPRVDLVKMDIQGFELNAAHGMQNVLSRNPKLVLLTEFWPLGMHEAGSDPSAYLRFLRSCGFELWEVDDRALRLEKLKVNDDEDLVERVDRSRSGYTNLLCARVEETIRPVLNPPGITQARA